MGSSLQYGRRKNRHSNVRKVTIDGIKFDSGSEASRYLDLQLMQTAGLIRNLTLQKRYKITIGGVPVMMRSAGYPNGRHMTYVADFVYLDVKLDDWIIEDVKMASGYRTDTYKIKKALMEAMGYEILET